MHLRGIVMETLFELGSSTAQEVADYCGIDPNQASVALLRCTRSGLVERRRVRRRSRWVSGPKYLFVYGITGRGLDRLCYWRSEDELA